jgi:hypothetical protein
MQTGAMLPAVTLVLEHVNANPPCESSIAEFIIAESSLPGLATPGAGMSFGRVEITERAYRNSFPLC